MAANVANLIRRVSGRVARLRDQLTGIDVERHVSVSDLGLDPARSHWYSNSGNKHLANVLRGLSIRSDDAIVDLGCGKGGALLTMSRFPFAKLVGVEISSELCAIAENNLTRRKVSNFSIVNADASRFVDFEDLSHIYMYNPFPCAVVENVLANLEPVLGHRAKPLTLIYRNPVCDEIVGRLFSRVSDFPSPEAHPIRVYRCKTI